MVIIGLNVFILDWVQWLAILKEFVKRALKFLFCHIAHPKSMKLISATPTKAGKAKAETRL